MSLKIGIITTTVRDNSVGKDIAKWTLDYAYSKNFENVEFEIVDLSHYNLPTFGSHFATEDQQKSVADWSKKIAEFDGYIFVTAEYNHLASGAIKNATDFLKKELHNKAAGFVGYGSLGGARAIESLRIVLAELQVATVQKTVNFLLAYDFENFSKFSPKDYHAPNADLMLSQLISWTSAIKTLR